MRFVGEWDRLPRAGRTLWYDLERPVGLRTCDEYWSGWIHGAELGPGLCGSGAGHSEHQRNRNSKDPHKPTFIAYLPAKGKKRVSDPTRPAAGSPGGVGGARRGDRPS